MWRSSQSDSAVRYLLAAEYRQYCRILVGVNAGFGDAPVMQSDSAGSSVRQRSCKRRNGHAVAAPGDNQRFEEACERLCRIIQQ
ncbi:hypothetical protein A0R06_25370 [Salmonella enterica]|nr:hypothetical protein [Salmonella enterica]EBT1279328.1 hypothetical protein [Salmonella enterica]